MFTDTPIQSEPELFCKEKQKCPLHMYKAGIIINNGNCAHLPQKSSYNTMTFVELFEKCEKNSRGVNTFRKALQEDGQKNNYLIVS